MSAVSNTPMKRGRRERRGCWVCQRRAIFTDWGGATWCWRHWRAFAMRPLRWAYFPSKVKP